MSLAIKIYSDYVCPYCFLAKGPLEEAAGAAGVDIEWLPFELRPYPAQTLRPEDEYLQRTWAESVYPLAARMGVEIVLPRVSPQPHTHLAFEGFHYAYERGKAIEYNDRVFAGFFQEEQDIGNIDALAGIAGGAGLDEADFRRALKSRYYKGAHERALAHARREAKIQAVPTIIIGSQIVRGLASREVLEHMIRKEIHRAQRWWRASASDRD